MKPETVTLRASWLRLIDTAPESMRWPLLRAITDYLLYAIPVPENLMPWAAVIVEIIDHERALSQKRRDAVRARWNRTKAPAPGPDATPSGNTEDTLYIQNTIQPKPAQNADLLAKTADFSAKKESFPPAPPFKENINTNGGESARALAHVGGSTAAADYEKKYFVFFKANNLEPVAAYLGLRPEDAAEMAARIFDKWGKDGKRHTSQTDFTNHLADTLRIRADISRRTASATPSPTLRKDRNGTHSQQQNHRFDRRSGFRIRPGDTDFGF